MPNYSGLVQAVKLSYVLNNEITCFLMIGTPLFKKHHPLFYVGEDRAITVVDSAVAEHSSFK